CEGIVARAQAETLALVVGSAGRQHPHRDLAGARRFEDGARPRANRPTAAHGDDAAVVSATQALGQRRDRAAGGQCRKKLGLYSAFTKERSRALYARGILAALCGGICREQELVQGHTSMSPTSCAGHGAPSLGVRGGERGAEKECMRTVVDP